MNSLEDMKKKYEELGEAIKRLEEKPAEWPQVGDEYWVGGRAPASTRSKRLIYKGDYNDEYLKAIGDMHRTKGEAEAYRAYRMNPRTVMRDKIQQFVDEYNNGWVWNVGDEYWTYDLEDRVVVGFSYIDATFKLKDEQGAELLLEKFGLDNILWACGGPEPGGEE